MFLFAQVAVAGPDVTAIFYVSPPESIDEPVRSRITSHFERLALAEVYAMEAANEIGMRREAIAMQLRDGDAQAVRQYLVQEALSAAHFAGTNHWRAALLRAMAASDVVCSGEFLVPPAV